MVCQKCHAKEARPGRKHCHKCAYKDPQYKSKKRKTKKASGCCKRCEKPILTPEFGSVCSEYCRQQVCKASIRTMRRLKIAALKAYGPLCCSCPNCPERHNPKLAFLTLDHVNGGGNKHKTELKVNKLYRWLKNQGYPPGYQVLCFNCNSGRSINSGVCPHMEDSDTFLGEVG
jgi:hypothetical protein